MTENGRSKWQHRAGTWENSNPIKPGWVPCPSSHAPVAVPLAGMPAGTQVPAYGSPPCGNHTLGARTTDGTRSNVVLKAVRLHQMTEDNCAVYLRLLATRRSLGYTNFALLSGSSFTSTHSGCV